MANEGSYAQPSRMSVPNNSHEDNSPLMTSGGGPETLFRLLEAVARHKEHAEDGEESDSLDADHVPRQEADDGTAHDHSPKVHDSISHFARLALSKYTGLPGKQDGTRKDHQTRRARTHSEEPDTSSSEDEEDPSETRQPMLSDEEKILRLQAEFGAGGSRGSPETLLSEVDSGILMEGTLLLGVLRLTTNRLSFHAHLLHHDRSTSSIDHVIMSGPVKVGRRRNLVRNRTAWCELTPDMLSTYPDSTEEGRVRPLRSYMLSAIKAIHFPKAREPNVFSITFEMPHARYNAYWEVGNEETALQWVRELRGAILLYNNRRKLYSDSPHTSNLRLSIPLSRIHAINSEPWMDLAHILIVELLGNDATGDASIPQPFASERIMSTSPDATQSDTYDAELPPKVVQFGLFGGEDTFARQTKHAWKLRGQDGTGNEDIILQNAGFEGNTVEDEPEDNGGAEDLRTMHEVRERFGIIDGKVWYERCLVRRRDGLHSYGLLIVTELFLCFWSKLIFISDLQLRYVLHDVQTVTPAKAHGIGWHGMDVLVTGHDELHFEFRKQGLRDVVLYRLDQAAEGARRRKREDIIAAEETPDSPISPLADIAVVAQKMERSFDPAVIPRLPKVINMPPNVRFRIQERHFICLSIGSRGDVQPYIALAKGLQKEGHTVTIVTHAEYRDWIEGWGVQHRTAGGDAAALMKLSVEHTMFSPQFFKETLSKFRQWLEDLLVDSWRQCQDADVLIESPSAMSGIHIAEALDIPYFRAFTMPWSRTRAYPHAFLSPPVEVSGAVNYSTYLVFDTIFWKATSGQVNRWRKKHLGLRSTDVRKLAQTRVPFLYNFSPSVVPKPLDWDDAIIITGYWFLDESDPDWKPTDALMTFLSKAKRDKKPVAYIGFGSIVVPNPAAMTRSIIEAVQKSGVRAILSEGWSARMDDSKSEDQEMPPEIHKVDKIPHDWLFPRIDVAVHHGGAGTTGASLRYGIPTVIKPWFGDQFFWATRVQKLGAGLRVASLKSDVLANALTKASTDRVMREKAAQIGGKIRAEDGVNRAIDAIYTYLPRAGQDRTRLTKHTRILDQNSEPEGAH